MKKIFPVLLFLPILVFGQDFRFKSIPPKTDASFRGLSVVDDDVAWVSGSKGWVGVTVNGGADWSFQQVKGFETADFRSLYAFDSKTAIIANAGSPAHILRTSDGGETWKVLYKNDAKEAFFDGIDFWNDEEGIIYGDPIQKRMLLLRTADGGNTWKELPGKNRPLLKDGEASFAASGTTVRCLERGNVIIATGGFVSRLWISDDKGMTWTPQNTPILQGESTRGIFSFAAINSKTFFIAGGDYKLDSLSSKHIFYTDDAGQHWSFPARPTRGYRECIEYLGRNVLLAAGPAGIDISRNAGITWIPFSDEKSFHVVRKARTGRWIVMAGGGGKISVLEGK
jgi:photosystem II stability/assembly factor-like uncharacterized protein